MTKNPSKEFNGKYIEMITKVSIMTNEGPAPFIIEGYLIDEDNSYFYIGDTPIQINKRIKKEDEFFTEVKDDGKEEMI